MRKLLSLLIPFFVIGFVLCMFALGMILFAYLFFFGLIVAIAIMMINWLKKTFIKTTPPIKPVEKRTGRIIDSDEWNQL